MSAKQIPWNDEQLAIFDEIENGRGHLVIEALAGTGKSTSVEEGIDYVPRGESILFLAFNADIVKAFKKRGTRAQTMTTHSLGLRTLPGRPEVDKEKAGMLLDGFFQPKDQAEREMKRAVLKLTALAKGCLVGEAEGLINLADEYGIEGERGRMAELSLRLLARCKEEIDVVDFDDMIWLPHVLDCTFPKYDRVFVDETQDLNKAQLEMVMKSCSPFGRICVVGDRHQAIYGFRGADSRAIPNIIARLDAKVLPLSVTYRCAKAIVREANALVPALRAAPDAPQGRVETTDKDRMVKGARPGDFILSRTNAPLMGICFQLLAEGRRATILGKDFGASLVSLVRKMKANTVPELVEKIGQWRDHEYTRLLKKKPVSESALSNITEKAECIYVLTDSVPTVEGVVRKIEHLFAADDREANADLTRVTLATTHKAKGLERERVWLLGDTYCNWEGEEEDNLYYVAVTRAKTDLFLVHDPEFVPRWRVERDEIKKELEEAFGEHDVRRFYEGDAPAELGESDENYANRVAGFGAHETNKFNATGGEFDAENVSRIFPLPSKDEDGMSGVLDDESNMEEADDDDL